MDRKLSEPNAVGAPSPVRVEREGPVLRLILNNPPANLMSLEMMEALQAQLASAGYEAAVRVVVIAAAGKVFSAGHDLKAMTAHRGNADGGRAYFEQVFAARNQLIESIVTLPKPVIAEVEGIATAAGCQLVASCDVAIASDHSRFGVNGIDVGLFCSTPAVALTRAVGMKRAMKMLLTGEMIDAATAAEFGLVNASVPQEALRQEVDKLAATLAAKSPTAVRIGKEAVRAQAGLSLADAYAVASRAIVENLLAADAEEGIGAFLEKRRPTWGPSAR